METLQVIGEGREIPGHRRGWSVGTWSTEVGTDDENGQGGKKGQLSRETSGGTRLSRKERKEQEREKANEAKVVAAQLDPEKDQTDPTPFREKPSRLAMLVDPKSLDDLEKIGGIDGLLDGLGVNGKKGLPSDEEGQIGGEGGGGLQWKASIEERRRVYGRNDLPDRKSKSLLLLMWLAFKDKVLVSQTLAR